MHNETEKTRLLEAIDSLQRELVVISSDHIILAANKYAKDKYSHDMVGKPCHQECFQCSKPCPHCPADELESAPVVAVSACGDDNLNIEEGFLCYPLYSGGQMEGVVRLDFDPPKMGRLEKKLERSNAFLHNLIMSSVDGVIAADMTGKVLVFNDAAAEILGYSKEEALSSLDIRSIYPGEGAREVMKLLRSDQCGERGKLKAYDIDVVHKNGGAIPIKLNASIVYENGQEAATIGFFHDMREAVKMEQELEETRMQLFQSAKMAALGKLAAGVAHQINNPLGGISLFAQLLLEEYSLEEGAQQDVQRILEDTQRCRDTVKELLEFARQSTADTKPEDVNRALSRTLFLLEKHAIFQNIEVAKDFDPELPLVSCDLQQMSHVFMNLILNAAEAMEGSGTLTISTRGAQAGSVQISISDTGPGIPKEVLSNIFDPFFTTKEAGKGTGLGLSVAYRIVQNHGGMLSAWNNPDKGARFWIQLPVKHAGEESEHE
jgi:PAS domain S-box-containing protein